MVKKRIKKNLFIKQKNLGVLLILVVVGIMLFRMIILTPPPLTGYFTLEGTTYLCENCTDCNLSIAAASSGDIINLTADISGVVGSCINFDGADNLTFDCQGYYIEGNDIGSTDYGIYLSTNSNNNTIKNCNVSDFFYGIYLATSSNNTLTNITSNSNTRHGIVLVSSSNNTLTNITSNSNTLSGIVLSDSPKNVLKNNNMSNNAHNLRVGGSTNQHFNNDIDTSNIVDYSYKIYYNYSISNYVFNLATAPEAGTVICADCDNITVRDLNLSHNNYDGLSLFNTTNSRIQNITSNFNFRGIHLYSSSNNTLQNITTNSNDYDGIYLYTGSNNFLQNINASMNSNSVGISLYSSPNNTLQNITTNSNWNGISIISHSQTIQDITTNSNTDYGIYLSSGSNSSFQNIIANSNNYGIYLTTSSNNSFQNIIANSNNGFGIYLSSSSNNTLQNITSNLNNNHGIYLVSSSDNILSNITTGFNDGNGVGLSSSNNNNLTNIIANSNEGGIMISVSSGNILKNNNMSNNTYYNFYPAFDDYINDVDTSNIVDYSYKIYYNYSVSNYVFNPINLPDAGTIFCYDCDNVTYENFNLSHNNYYGLWLHNLSNSTVQNITANSNYQGISIRDGSNNILNYTNTNDNNQYGVYLQSNNNSIISNIISDSNTNYGIELVYSNNNWIGNATFKYNSAGLRMRSLSTNNTATNITADSNTNGIYILSGPNNVLNNSYIRNNTGYGIQFSGNPAPNNNLFYNNYFNNTVNYYNATNVTNYFNTTLNCTSGQNIIGENCTGGNFWATPTNTGFSDTCVDADSDGICDLTYSLDGLNYDYLPLAGDYVSCIESWTCTAWSTCVSSLQTRTCTDANACGTTTTKPVESQSCTNPSGSAPPGVTADQPLQSFSWDIITPEQPAEMEITNPEIDITSISVDVSETVEGASIEVTLIDVVAHADIMIDFGGDSYQSFQIDVTGLNDTNIEEVTIEFKVNKTWIDEENGTTEEIILYRKEDTGNKWDELTTTFVSSDDDYYYFLATSPSFSSFTIALKIARMIECIPEEKKCVGNILQQCSANGMTWETIETCDYKCSRNKCVAEFEFSVLIFYIITVVLSVGIFVLIFVGYRYFSKRKLVQQAEKRIEISKNRREDYLEKS